MGQVIKGLIRIIVLFWHWCRRIRSKYCNKQLTTNFYDQRTKDRSSQWLIWPDWGCLANEQKISNISERISNTSYSFEYQPRVSRAAANLMAGFPPLISWPSIWPLGLANQRDSRRSSGKADKVSCAQRGQPGQGVWRRLSCVQATHKPQNPGMQSGKPGLVLRQCHTNITAFRSFTGQRIWSETHKKQLVSVLCKAL